MSDCLDKASLHISERVSCPVVASRVLQPKPIVMAGSGRSQGNGIVTEYVDNPFFLRRLHGCRRSTPHGAFDRRNVDTCQ